MTLRTALGLFPVLASASAPFLPETASRLDQTLPELAGSARRLEAGLADLVPSLRPGSPFVAPGLLFAKLEDSQLEAWELRFGGTAAG
jgi:methionyl-tRNA synthetase